MNLVSISFIIKVEFSLFILDIYGKKRVVCKNNGQTKSMSFICYSMYDYGLVVEGCSCELTLGPGGPTPPAAPGKPVAP